MKLKSITIPLKSILMIFFFVPCAKFLKNFFIYQKSNTNFMQSESTVHSISKPDLLQIAKNSVNPPNIFPCGPLQPPQFLPTSSLTKASLPTPSEQTLFPQLNRTLNQLHPNRTNHLPTRFVIFFFLTPSLPRAFRWSIV